MDEKILKELKEQTKWIKFLALPNLKKIIEENLLTKELKKMYSLTDGKNSTHDISKKLTMAGMKVSRMTVYNYWKRWNAIGLVIPSEKYNGRFQKIINLEEININ